MQTGVPCGSFVLNEESEKPLVLISGGVGLTPMVAMLEHVVENNPSRPITFIQSVRTANVHAMKKDLDAIVGANDQVKAFVFYTDEEVTAEEAGLTNFDVRTGRMTHEALDEIISNKDSDVYYCGPDGFMDKMKEELQAIGIPDNQTYFEAFGPTTQ